VRTAAVALSLGWSDPMELLGLEPYDWTVAVAVVNRAAELRAERDAKLVDAISRATGQRTIAALAKAMRGK